MKEYDSNLSLYRQTAYEYVTNALTDWVISVVSRRILKDGNGTIISVQEYGYDGQLPGTNLPLTTKPTLSRVVNGTQTIDTGYVYDDYGNLTETRLYKNYGTTGSQPTGSYVSYVTSYSDDPSTNNDDLLLTYATSSTNPLGHITRTHYDYGTGLPTVVKDPNLNSTMTTYDGVGRVLTVTYPGYNQPNIQYTYPELHAGTLPGTYRVYTPFATKMDMWDETANTYRSTWQIIDGLGRVVQTQGPYETAGVLVITDTLYNAQGAALYNGLPRTYSRSGGTYYAPVWGSVPHTTTSYDALGRVTAVNHPDGSVENSYYWWLRAAFVDRNRHTKIQQKDAFGRLTRVEEDSGSNSPYTLYAATNYLYDVRDLLTQVTDAANNITTINYDGYGRKIEMTDPDLGNWRYQYDPLGNLTAQIDAKRQASNLYYDDLNRLIGKTYNAGPVDATTYQRPGDPGYNGYVEKYYYDQGTNGIGHRTSMSNSNSSTSWTYNALGQANDETHTVESMNYNIHSNFDAFGRAMSQTIPSNGGAETLSYSYNAMGALSSLTGANIYVSQIHYNASGQVTDQLLGNNLHQLSCYDANTLRLTALRTYSGALQTCGTIASNPLFNFTFSYQPNGNINQIVDSVRNETLNYSYDEQDRLLGVNGSDNQSYNYDKTGNMTSKGTPASPGVTGLAAWWDMNETSGTRYDSQGSSQLTDNNTVSYAAGLRGNAASFVPANYEYLSIADNAALSGGRYRFYPCSKCVSEQHCECHGHCQ